MTDKTDATSESSSVFDKLESRGRFIRRVAVLAAAGAAALLVPAVARANVLCCKNDQCAGSCSGTVPYKCQDSCTGASCCICMPTDSGCIEHPCGFCG
jgi:hypothetical protein